METKDSFLKRKNVEISFKRYGIDVNVRPQYLGAFSTDCTGVLDDLLTKAAQKNTHILKTILITAGIKNTVCIDTYHLL